MSARKPIVTSQSPFEASSEAMGCHNLDRVTEERGIIALIHKFTNPAIVYILAPALLLFLLVEAAESINGNTSCHPRHAQSQYHDFVTELVPILLVLVPNEKV